LIGNDMSQFHIDFDLEGACGEVYCNEAYYLAKKVYNGDLESFDTNKDLINGDHVRLKSVPTSCVLHTAKKMDKNVMELYKYLFGKNNTIKFDLTEGGQNCGFKYNPNLTVRSYEANEFTREIGFSPDIERIEFI
jgi:hypothetical protein